MDVLSIIKQEHREVAALIDQIEGCEPGAPRLVEIAREIETKLSMHLSIEERLFYSKLKERAEEQDELVDMFEAYTEHAGARTLMDMVRSGRKPDEKFKAELQVLGENVKHHVKEEESKVFDIAKSVMESEEREEIGEAWEKAKARAMKAQENGGAKAPARKKSTRGTVSRAKSAR